MLYICSVVFFLHVAKVRYKTHKNKNMKKIKVTPEERKWLQERFQVGGNYMMDVLAFRKDGPTARKIRRAALEMGGRYVDPKFSPNCRITYQNGFIIQTFNEGIVLRIELSTGNYIISKRDEVIDKGENATMNQWMAAAFYAQTVAESEMIAK